MDDLVVREIDAQAAKAAVERGALLLDVRQPEELELARIAGALHIPMNDIPVRLRELPADRPIVVFCHKGARSYGVAGYLMHCGYSDVASLDGGIDAWAAFIDPGVGRY